MGNFAPSPQNYTLGRGVVYIDRKLSDGTSTGERDVGNAPEFNITFERENLEHFSSRSGVSAKDKEVTLQITPGVSFTLDEINVENLRLIFLAERETVVQAAADFGISPAVQVVAKENRFKFLGRQIGRAHV